MGNKPSSVKNDCIEELTNINEEDLDISKIDKLQIKAIKEMSERLGKLEKEKREQRVTIPSTICSDHLVVEAS